MKQTAGDESGFTSLTFLSDCLQLIPVWSTWGQLGSSVEISNQQTKPVDNFQERKQTEAEEETKQAAHRGYIVHQAHLKTTLVFCI